MDLKELTAGDLDELLSLYSHLHAVDDPLPDRQIVASVWSDILGSDNFKYFGVFVDQKLISCCSLSIIPNLTRGCRPYGVIENVVTHRKFRRRIVLSRLRGPF